MTTATPNRKFVINGDDMSQDFFVWSREVTETLNGLAPILGNGSPDGVIDALAGRFYVDQTAAAGSVLYVKQVNNIGGDNSLGWALV